MDATKAKRKRVSKNKKKAWRKHTDIKDVEDFIDDMRLQERTGGIVADKPDSSLFFLDRTEEEDVPKKKSRREPKPLKCHELLRLDARVKPLRTTNNKKSDSLKKKCGRVRDKIESGLLSKTEELALKQRKKAKMKTRTRRIQNRQPFRATFDLWGEEEEKLNDETFVSEPKKVIIKPPAHMKKKPSELPAVEVAHPGASYNPSYEDHQVLLQKAYQVELKKVKAEERMLRKLESNFPTKAEAPTEETWLNEMSAGLFETEADETEQEVGSESLSLNPPVRREDKKTEKQRKKEKLRKEKEEKLLTLKEKRKKDQEFFRLKSIKREVTQVHKLIADKAKRKAEIQKKYRNKPKKLGKVKYEEPDLELHLTEELTGSLRLMKPEGNLLEDRFKSFQKRNIVEVREKVSSATFKRKHKNKMFEKPGHKAIIS